MALSCSHYNIPQVCEGDNGGVFKLPLFGPGFQQSSGAETTCYTWQCKEYDGVATYCQEDNATGEIYCAERQSGNAYGCRAMKRGDYIVNYPQDHHHHHRRQYEVCPDRASCDDDEGCAGTCRSNWQNFDEVCPLDGSPSTTQPGQPSPTSVPGGPPRRASPGPSSPGPPPPPSPRKKPATHPSHPTSPAPAGSKQCTGCVEEGSRWLCPACQ